MVTSMARGRRHVQPERGVGRDGYQTRGASVWRDKELPCIPIDHRLVRHRGVDGCGYVCLRAQFAQRRGGPHAGEARADAAKVVF